MCTLRVRILKLCGLEGKIENPGGGSTYYVNLNRKINLKSKYLALPYFKKHPKYKKYH